MLPSAGRGLARPGEPERDSRGPANPSGVLCSDSLTWVIAFNSHNNPVSPVHSLLISSLLLRGPKLTPLATLIIRGNVFPSVEPSVLFVVHSCSLEEQYQGKKAKSPCKWWISQGEPRGVSMTRSITRLRWRPQVEVPGSGILSPPPSIPNTRGSWQN